MNEGRKGLPGRLHIHPSQMTEPSVFVAVLQDELQINCQAVGHAAVLQEVGVWSGRTRTVRM
jgi:hypothetical protein